MVRAQDDVVPQQQLQQQSSQHQFVDPAMLKLLHKTESLFEFDDIAAWDSPPDTPSSVSSDEAFATRGDLKSEWDALFHDTMDGPKSDSSSSASSPASATSAAVPSSGTSSASPSSASSSVMWNFDLPLSHLDNFEHDLFHGSHHLFSGHSSSSSGSSATTIASSASNSSLAAVMASAAHMHAMPDLDFSHGLEMDVFGLDSGAVPPPPPPTPIAMSPSVPSAASTPSASTTSSSSSSTSSSSSAKVSVHKPHIRAIVFDKKKTTVSALDKRKNSEDDSMEAKKARARQTRDEIVAKTQAALRQGVKGDNPEMRRITHNVLERKRREDLKVSYQELRSFVPEVMHNDRAPTGQILGKAVDYIHALRAEEHELLQKLAAMRQENERLRNRML